MPEICLFFRVPDRPVDGCAFDFIGDGDPVAHLVTVSLRHLNI